MKLYFWSIKSVPEFQGLDPARRAEAWRACQLRPWRESLTWLAFAALLLWLGFWAHVACVVDTPVCSVICLVLAGTGGFAFANYGIWRTRRYLREYLDGQASADRPAPIQGGPAITARLSRLRWIGFAVMGAGVIVGLYGGIPLVISAIAHSTQPVSSSLPSLEEQMDEQLAAAQALVRSFTIQMFGMVMFACGVVLLSILRRRAKAPHSGGNAADPGPTNGSDAAPPSEGDGRETE